MGVLKNNTYKVNKAATKISASGKSATMVIHKAHVLTKREVEMNRSSAYNYAF
ncbi:hypothetical protein RM553_10800 [Zunongwangia sp. F363]|uniref:Uncharacterized protein n=1 Tax=Autumnicola tepida TaxID=3075595 RepID=A0ABU3CAN4_9FLAO|nr:hypothetical protein [Zunongwangia sp. F363]MDT0643318.1 hypothetical protein [Zunongwangia sp. F363]